MWIKLSPVRADERLTEATVDGDAITLNGETLDFADLPEGAYLPEGAIACPWVVGAVSRVDGSVRITLRLPHGPNAPRDSRFPDAFHEPFFVSSGAVPLPDCEGVELVHD